jgi:RNA polymerase sigma factor (TIGR02999 family)
MKPTYSCDVTGQSIWRKACGEIDGLDSLPEMREPASQLISSPGPRQATLDSTLVSLVEATEKGDPSATEALFSDSLSELHRLASRELARRGGGVSLSVTTLLHEACLDMAERAGMEFPDRARFMGYAMRVMRTFIIDHARRRQAHKRGLFEITSLGQEPIESPPEEHDLAQVSDALNKLAEVDSELADLVDLKFSCGFAEELRSSYELAYYPSTQSEMIHSERSRSDRNRAGITLRSRTGYFSRSAN